MAALENLPRLPSDVKFRVLIIGRANAGKTSILQRVCDTTESPEIYSVDSSGDRKRVGPPLQWHF
jgi:GTP-binding protein EngB required for normal cell division